MPDLPAVESEADSPQQIILEFFIALVRMLSGEFFLLEQHSDMFGRAAYLEVEYKLPGILSSTAVLKFLI